MKTAKIQIFKAGVYGNSESRVWSREECQQLVDNYDVAFRSAPIILGHNDWNGEKPAYGYAQTLGIDDNGVVFANIEYNDALGEMVEQKMYTRVSIEATKKIELYDRVDGRSGAYCLAIALLGGTQPAVSGLEPVHFSAEDGEHAFSLENEIEVFDVKEQEDAGSDDEEGVENDVDTPDVTSDKIVDEVDSDESTETQKEEYTVKTAEELKAEQEALKADREAFKAEQDAFKLEQRKGAVAKFMNDNAKRIVPAQKENIESFMTSLDDEKLEKFQEIISAFPENEIFKNMEDGQNEQKHIDTDEKFAQQALDDIKATKK